MRLAFLLATLLLPPLFAVTGAETQSRPKESRLKIVSGRFYPADARPERGGRKVIAVLRVLEPAAATTAPSWLLHLLDDTRIEVESVGDFAMRSVTKAEFTELFTKDLLVTALHEPCGRGAGSCAGLVKISPEQNP
jgi:hypothetical protein